MTLLQIIGIVLLLLPFVAGFVTLVLVEGWRFALEVFAIFAGATSLIAGGILLGLPD